MQSGILLDGAESTSTLASDEPVEIVRILGEVVHITIVIHDGETEHRFQAPVSTGIPSSFLLSHLISWLSLSDGDWIISVDGQTVLPMQTLAELNVQHDSMIEVSK